MANSAEVDDKNYHILNSFTDVDIDESGTFKYILIKLTDRRSSSSKFIVRGYSWASYHADILDRLTASFEAASLTVECVGGGRIRRNENEILVYGYSTGFGRADHTITAERLRKAFPTLKISYSNDGY
ncbi:14 kDa phosphohistidine phosphatase [Trichoplax sp. H2]|uniref:14 kDa phosphohistidine phosphatase n=1 Tax=Trichoplax adhaerens TaxID=10228 RepID=B3RN85_TRIAD|nr:hypothetical protein TRIADDRAFT_53076 [Trichoplax adhaerens]EDV27409.1 hypothetical protein TRIADDRAFT_53076 [Trichoplax adhaerens]RDD43940.1 14 kDa phosphohistidine phosphatase [Trichoplax sp. H2]|eukprot:XP_002109243.1 hypothetical protein TRIADDRAFT_53076 [Trichoplax adhaerens]